MFLGEVVLKICSKRTGEHPSRNLISIKLQSNFIEVTLRHGYSPVNSRQIFRTSCSQSTSGRLLLKKNSAHEIISSIKSLFQIDFCFIFIID